MDTLRLARGDMAALVAGDGTSGSDERLGELGRRELLDANVRDLRPDARRCCLVVVWSAVALHPLAGELGNAALVEVLLLLLSDNERLLSGRRAAADTSSAGGGGGDLWYSGLKLIAESKGG